MEKMFLREIKPSTTLASLVRIYRIIDFQFPNNDPIPPKAYTPRPEQCLQFFPTPTVIDYAGQESTTPKNALLIGQHTVTNNRTVFQKFLSLQIIFQPGALYRITGLPLHLLTNQLIDAEAVFGKEIENVNDQLYHAKSHEEMVAVAEAFVLAKLKNIKLSDHPIDDVATKMLNVEQSRSLAYFVDQACLSHRQFNRKFADRVGISPKEYLRIARFDQAYRLKNQQPLESWFNIAIACGYHDYQHLCKDYKDFTGYTPAAFFAMESPERQLGFEEVY